MLNGRCCRRGAEPAAAPDHHRRESQERRKKKKKKHGVRKALYELCSTGKKRRAPANPHVQPAGNMKQDYTALVPSRPPTEQAINHISKKRQRTAGLEIVFDPAQHKWVCFGCFEAALEA